MIPVVQRVPVTRVPVTREHVAIHFAVTRQIAVGWVAMDAAVVHWDVAPTVLWAAWSSVVILALMISSVR